MTSCLVAINKDRDMCFDTKNDKKKQKQKQNKTKKIKKIKHIFQWRNPVERLSNCVERVKIYKIN